LPQFFLQFFRLLASKILAKKGKMAFLYWRQVSLLATTWVRRQVEKRQVVARQLGLDGKLSNDNFKNGDLSHGKLSHGKLSRGNLP
jgi:hypothetical protein